MKTREAGRLVFLLALAVLAAACDRPPPAAIDPAMGPVGSAAAAPEAVSFTIVPGPGGSADLRPVRRRADAGHPLAYGDEPDFTCEDVVECVENCNESDAERCCCLALDGGGFNCYEGESCDDIGGGGGGGGVGGGGSGGGGGGGGVGGGGGGRGGVDWSCGDLRDTLAAEYDSRAWECWKFYRPGSKWVVPGSQGIEYGRKHGHYGYVASRLRFNVSLMEILFNIVARTNSGYRCPIGNRSIPGAAANSWHIYGRAYDFEVPGWTQQLKEDIVAWARANGAIEAYWYPDKPHVHVAW